VVKTRLLLGVQLKYFRAWLRLKYRLWSSKGYVVATDMYFDMSAIF